jgi:predicted nuclease of restriction endonuclease-like RecB superfamily
MSGTETSATPSQPPAPAQTQTPNYRLPSDVTLQHASKLAIVEDKPIMLDYWTQSLEKKVLVGVRESGEKLLVKSAEEYTSAISKFYKSATEYIVVTENSIYIVSSDIPSRRIS